MIPTARFGDIIVAARYSNSITCNLYGLYEGGIAGVAENKEFCLFLLTDLYRKLAMHDYQVMSWNGATSREDAKALFNNLDETSHLFYKECLALLKGTVKTDGSDEAAILLNEEKFRRIASKVITDFSVSEIEPMDSTFQEYAMLEFNVGNAKLIDHITEGLLVEC
ncbi:hypothetical protein AAEO56_12870 [Flavobacterium sp. DGU11]|uniref:DUF4375 domain-containing protein n=1 Tax=Flavobacterium arundinis TaxID=3139143 RepID=A0ABU9HYC1_9FLAO